MQWMKTNATTIGVEQRLCPQMVHIKYYSCQKNECHFYSMLLKKEKSNENGDQKMDAVMYNMSIHPKSLETDFLNKKVYWFLH